MKRMIIIDIVKKLRSFLSFSSNSFKNLKFEYIISIPWMDRNVITVIPIFSEGSKFKMQYMTHIGK